MPHIDKDTFPFDKNYTRSNIRTFFYLFVAIGLVTVLSCTTGNPNVPVTNTRPAHWATPVKKKGVPNLHKVSDALYRSAQPKNKGMKELDSMGIKTVINLRRFSSDKDYLENTNLVYKHIRMKAWKPKEYQVVEFLKIATNPQYAPVLVHCKHGADRTGIMCAVYRIVVQNWTKKESLEEMTNGGYGFHMVWNNLITWLMELDLEKIKAKAGIRKEITDEKQI